jgi:phosphate starvation-inducible PhoH-like protein
MASFLCLASKEASVKLLTSSVKARNPKQARFLELLKAPKPDVLVGVGPAGCGKTMLSTCVGVQKLNNNEVRKLILTRPMVSVDEELGIMPGGLLEKVAPWMMPFQDVLLSHYTKGVLEKMMRDNIIEICPLAIMRGRSFENAWIICDEAQNTTPSQMLMLLTRLGRDSKVIVTGDPDQYDRGFENNGLIDLLSRYNGQTNDSSWLNVVEFDDGDVERNHVIKKILKLYRD